MAYPIPPWIVLSAPIQCSGFSTGTFPLWAFCVCNVTPLCLFPCKVSRLCAAEISHTNIFNVHSSSLVNPPPTLRKHSTQWTVTRERHSCIWFTMATLLRIWPSRLQCGGLQYGFCRIDSNLAIGPSLALTMRAYATHEPLPRCSIGRPFSIGEREVRGVNAHDRFTHRVWNFTMLVWIRRALTPTNATVTHNVPLLHTRVPTLREGVQ